MTILEWESGYRTCFHIIDGEIDVTLSDKLQKLQNRVVCALTRSSYDAGNNQLLTAELGWDNLETRRQKLKAEMVSKSLTDLTRNYLSSKFIPRSECDYFLQFVLFWKQACHSLAAY